MLKFPNKGRLVESAEELPNLQGRELFLDCETSSGDPKKKSVNPWRDCSLLGVAVTADDTPESWYVPRELCMTGWLEDTLEDFDVWINHNLKYDMHVLKNDVGLEFQGPVVDTVTTAKLVYSDFFSYSLEFLGDRWLPGRFRKTSHLIRPYLENSQDFADIPIEKLAEYGCGDVLSNRALHRLILERLPETSKDVYDTEAALTKTLWRMEQRGVKLRPEAITPWTATLPPEQREQIESNVSIMELAWGQKVLAMQMRLQELLCKNNLWDDLEDFRPHNNRDCYKLLCEALGYPVLRQTEGGLPSFDAATIEEYKTLERAPIALLNAIEEFRSAWTINSLFVEKYNELQVDGKLHPSFNQTVRTGRMSCRDPNMQQLNTWAKKLITPDEGMVFISTDASQIEFRTCIHYIKNERCIFDYKENPNVDFHQWVADMCGIPRRPAKNVNFAMVYGGGKKRVHNMLAATPELVDEFREQEGFRRLCRIRAQEVYDSYHDALPELKPTSKRAADVVRYRSRNENIPENAQNPSNERRGYTVNHYGRRRHLPVRLAHIAFNTLNQGTAADIMKERMVACEDMLASKHPDVQMLLAVHDEILCQAPKDADHAAIQADMADVLEHPARPLRVPIKWDFGKVVDTCWADCG